MAKGDKPVLSISLRRKDARSRDRVDIASGWRGKFGGYDISFRDVAEIVMKDGRVLKLDEHWCNGKCWDEPQQTRSANTPTGEPSGGGGIDDPDGIPF